MDQVAALYFSLIVPLCLWLLALVCVGVWWGMGRAAYLWWYALGSSCGGLALAMQTLATPHAYSKQAMWVTPIYLLTVVGLTKALSLRLGTQMRWRWTLVVAVTVEVLAIYFSLIEENLSVRMTVLAVGLTTLMLQIAPGLLRLRWRELNFADKGLVVGYGAYAAFVVLRPALLLWNPQSFAQPFVLGVSLIWLITLYGSLILGIGFAGFFLAAAGLDSIQQLRNERDRDPLTGLLNRRALFESEAAETAGSVVAICDLDHFKHINDRWGHPVGDEVLKAIADILSAHVRRQDRVARLGGEEFVLTLHDITLDVARQRLEQIRQQVEHTVFAALGPGVRVTLSLGAVQMRPGEPLADAIARADAQLYAAKQSGRNRVCWEEPGLAVQ